MPSSEPSSPARVLRLVLAAAYLVLWAGFFLHRSRPSLCLGPLPWSAKYVAFLALLGLPLVALALAGPLARRFGRTRLLVVAVALALPYCVAREHYHYTQEHRFDPFLQFPNPRFEEVAEIPRPAGVVRVLCLGGSTTRNRTMPPAARWPEVVRAELAAAHEGVAIEVLNAGQDSYTTRHSLAAYTAYGRTFEPDVVLVMHAINDVVRSFSPAAFALGEYDDLWTHYYQAAADGANPPTFERHLFDRPFENWCSTLRVRAVDVPLGRFRSLGRFRANLAAIVDYARADGATVVVLGQPMLLVEEPSAAERDALAFGRAFCLERRGAWSREYPDARSMWRAMSAFRAATAEVARASGALHLDGQATVERSLEHYVDDAHMTAAGSERFGRAIAAFLVREGVVADVLARR